MAIVKNWKRSSARIAAAFLRVILMQSSVGGCRSEVASASAAHDVWWMSTMVEQLVMPYHPPRRSWRSVSDGGEVDVFGGQSRPHVYHSVPGDHRNDVVILLKGSVLHVGGNSFEVEVNHGVPVIAGSVPCDAVV